MAINWYFYIWLEIVYVNFLLVCFFVFNCLYAISDLKGYDAEKINEWVLNNPDSILPKDGVEYEILEVSLGENGNSLTSDVFKVLSFI